MCCTNPNNGRLRYSQWTALLGELRRNFHGDAIQTWPVPDGSGAHTFAIYSDDDETPIERGYISADGDIRNYLTEVAA